MREILFRGFHKNENGKETIYLNGKKIKGYWVYGYVVIDKVGYSDNDTNEDIYYIAGNSDAYIEVIPETIGQYTGLVDKNGKKIFEGDIIKYEDEKTSYIVMFDPTGYWCLDGNGARNSEMLNSIFNEDYKYIEIIGTIFDKEKNNE